MDELDRDQASTKTIATAGAIAGAAALIATGRDAKVEDPAPPPAGATYCLSGLDRSGNEGIVSAPLTVSS